MKNLSFHLALIHLLIVNRLIGALRVYQLL
jgi:hypothetical protein